MTRIDPLQLTLFQFLACFCTAKSNSPQPVEEEEKEKAPPAEESGDASKDEETKMEH